MFEFIETVEKRAETLKSKEQILGKSLYQPFTDANSGARKIMAATQLEHALPLYESEVAIVQTGYEIRYGDYSSAIIKTDSPIEIVGKISKFSKLPNHHYYLIIRNMETNELDMIERKSYKYSMETYGHLYDNATLDSLDIGYEVPKNTIIRKSTSTDEYLNRMDGVNLNTIHMACDITKEDGMWLSESGRRKLASPLFKRVTRSLNDNDIFLDLMGENGSYKSFPNIGEEIKNGMLCAIRREQSDNALFTQSVSQLKRPMMSDDKYTIKDGVVADITINCNNPAILKEKHTNAQVLEYYNDWIRCITEIVSVVNRAREKYDITKLAYTLDKFYVNCKRELAGVQFMDEKVYGGSYIEFMIIERNLPSVGDKITNRYGGKGVISKITRDDLMPRTADTNEVVDLIMNSCTCVNRINPGQAHEMSLTHISRLLIDFMRTNVLSTAECMNMIVIFLSYCSVEEASSMAEYFNNLEEEDKDVFVQQVIDDGFIQMSIKPMSESMTQDKIAEIYREFNWIHQRPMLTPLIGSTGKVRYVYSRRPMVFGKMYIYRLKQYAEEKHSITSLSSTNLRGENSRSKLNKNYKALHQATPVRFGYMEVDDMNHIGTEYVMETLMIHSLSPQARRLVENMYKDNPYDINIELDADSKNRSAEQVNVYLKAIGYKLVFTKRKKTSIAPFTVPLMQYQKPLQDIFKIVSADENFDIDKWIEFCNDAHTIAKEYPFTLEPITIDEEI